uniref:Uncharacterized protein n=1 Tax=Cucumis melo TaxID=3656 RepID=A0A9I9D176_CUCME
DETNSSATIKHENRTRSSKTIKLEDGKQQHNHQIWRWKSDNKLSNLKMEKISIAMNTKLKDETSNNTTIKLEDEEAYATIRLEDGTSSNEETI